MKKADKVANYYDVNHSALVERYSSLSFNDVHSNLLKYLPPVPANILDIGAGIGRDAIGMARLGYSVTACEPTRQFREEGIHRSINQDIVWVDDKLPDLKNLLAAKQMYDVVLISAVWMHLCKSERVKSLKTIKKLLCKNGFAYITYRSKSVDPDGINCELSVSNFKNEVSDANFEIVNEFTSSDIEGRANVIWYMFILKALGQPT